MPVRMMAEASRSWRDCAVSTTSVEVRPKCSQREAFSSGRGGVDVFGDGGGEGDDVVADFGLDLVDAGDGEVGAGGDGVCGGLRDEAEAGEGLAGGDFDGEPARYLFSSDQMRPMAGRV
jgi:hypothetical protein